MTKYEDSPGTTRIEDHRDLFGARSVVGAVVVIAVLTFFGVGLQAIDNWVRDSSGFQVGEAVAVTDLVSFTPAAGWIAAADKSVPGLVAVAEKNGWEFKVAGALTLQAGQTLESFVKVFYDEPAKEPGAAKSDLTTFTTASGEVGLTWTTHGTTATTQNWVIANGDQLAKVRASGPSSTLDSVQSEVDAMAASVSISAGAEVAK